MGYKRLLTAAAGVLLALAACVPAASAASLHIEGTTGPFTVKGEQASSNNIVYTFEGGLQASCASAVYEGSATSAVEETLKLGASFSSCKAFGFSSAEVADPCNDDWTRFLLWQGNFFAAALYDFFCPKSAMTIKAGTCEITIGEQTGKETEGVAENVASSPKTIDLEPHLTSITYTKTKDGFGCPLSGTGEKSDGTLTGHIKLKAFEGVTQRGLYLE
jgi:hypothetical protein